MSGGTRQCDNRERRNHLLTGHIKTNKGGIIGSHRSNRILRRWQSTAARQTFRQDIACTVVKFLLNNIFNP